MARKIDKIIIHCAATKPSMDIGKAEIDKWHRARGFFSIGYHFVIRRNGDLETGRPIEKIGAHVEGHNATSIGICLVGGINETTAKAENNFTDAQWRALKKLVLSLKKTYPSAQLIGHNELSSKDCPCFSVPKWVASGMNKI